ncbi:hypothetical protein ILUMI_12633, partial [Ignelater luminosus]
ELQRKIRKKIRQAKEQYMTSKSKEIVDLNSRHDTFDVHKKIKEATGRYKKMSARHRKTAKKYFPKTQGPEITQSQVEYAIKTAKGGKAPGSDEIPMKLLEVMEKIFLIEFFNKTYNTRIIPNKWLISSLTSERL